MTETKILSIATPHPRAAVRSLHVPALAKLAAFTGLTILAASCGRPDGSADEYRSSLLGVEGTGEHEVCATEVNVRDPGNVGSVTFVSKQGDRVIPQGKTTTWSGYLFHLVQFKATGKKGYVANDFLCKVGTTTLGAARIVVNLTTNRLTFSRGNTVIRSWNVGTARAGKVTPVGSFKVRIKQTCPRYYGADGDKNVAGCIAANPLGTRALWWQDTIYGLHGTNQPALIAEGTTADQRRVSSGCVRNLNANIEWLYDQVRVGDSLVVTK